MILTVVISDVSTQIYRVLNSRNLVLAKAVYVVFFVEQKESEILEKVKNCLLGIVPGI